MANNIVSIANFTVLIDALTAIGFTKCSAVKRKRDSSKVALPNQNLKGLVLGVNEVDDVTLEKPYDLDTDKALEDYYLNFSGAEASIQITPIKYTPQVAPLGRSVILLGAKPIALESHDVDQDSTSPSMIKITFSVKDYKYSG